TREHFDQPTEYYLTKEETMSPEELASLGKLQAYVDGFVPARYVDRAGDPILDAKGNERVEKQVINTKELLSCRSIAEVKICLGTDRE
ncbi:hypothetical protein A2U01_0076791, partial [Trifolium medium]|nr:hypothetical protein [Trifolium medium]